MSTTAEGPAIDLAASLSDAEDTFIACDLERRVILWNAAAERLYGYPASEALGQPALFIVPPAYLDKTTDRLGQVLAGGSAGYQDTRRLRRDGSLVDVSITISALRGADGQIVGALSSHRDITERVRERDALRLSFERLSLSQRMAGVGSWEFVLATDAVDWSAELHRIFGVDPQTFVPSIEAFHAMVVAEDRDRVGQVIESAMNDHQPVTFEHRIVRGDGVVRVLRSHAEIVHDPEDRVVGLFGTAHDVTELRLLEGELRRQNQTLELVSQATNDAVWEISIPGYGLVWQHGLDAYGYRDGHRTQSAPNVITHVHPDDADRVRASARAAFAGQATSWSCEHRLRRTDGTYANVLARGYIVRDPDGVAVRMIGSLLDLTEHQRVNELEHRNAASAVVLGRASHELRTPLSAILGFAGVLEEQLGSALNARQRRYFQNIRSAGRQLLVLIDDVLDLSAGTAGRLEITREPIGLQTLLAPVAVAARERAAAKAIALSFDAPGDPSVVVDADRVRQILAELLANAVRFTPDGGAVAFHARVRDGSLDLIVSDSGIGIPADRRDRVFGAFERLHGEALAPSGAGLGLALVRQIVEAHGGTISFVSTEGVGTSFRVILPAVVAGSDQVAAAS